MYRPSRIALAVARALCAAPLAFGAADTIAEDLEGAAMADGRAHWRAPLRASVTRPGPDGRADWLFAARRAEARRLAELTELGAAAPLDAAAAPADGGWIDVVVDGVLEEVPRRAPSTRAPAPRSAPTPARGPVSAAPAPANATAAPAPRTATSRRPAPLPGSRPASPPRDSLVPRGGAANALPPAPREPRDRDRAAPLRWLRRVELGRDLGGAPCAAVTERLADTEALGEDLDRLAERVHDPSTLEAGVSRRWSVLRLGCEPGDGIGVDRLPETTAPTAGEGSGSADPSSASRSAEHGERFRSTSPESGVGEIEPTSAPTSTNSSAAGAGGEEDRAGESTDSAARAARASSGEPVGGPMDEPARGTPPPTGPSSRRVPDGATDALSAPDLSPALPPGALPPPGAPDTPFGEPSDGGPFDVPSGAEPGSLFLVGDDVPAGFEALAAPQTLFVDMRFNGRTVGATEVTTTVETLVFEYPAEVVAMLEDIEDPEALLALLAEPLPTNADRVCFADGDPPGCGTIEASPVAIILDEATLAVDVFLAPGLQTAQSREGVRYLDRPERRPSSILSLYAAASDVEGGEPSFDLSGRLLAGYGGGHLRAALDYGSLEDETVLRELALTHFADGHELTAGTYGWAPGEAWTDVDLVGMSFSTSFRTRLDVEQAFGTEIVVFLARRAVVQLLVDGRVQSGDSYEPGNQVIDTRALPDGTYPLEIRVIESDGSTRSEFRTFTRSTLIPPRGEPVFEATAGVARLDGELFPRSPEPLVAGFSLANRLGGRAAWRLGATQLGRRGFGRAELVYLGERLGLQAALAAGAERTLATSLNASLSVAGGTFSASHRNFESDIDREGDPVAETLYPSEGTRWSLSASRPLGKTLVRAAATRRRIRDAAGDTAGEARELTRYELGLRHSIGNRRGLRGSVGLGVGREGEESFVTARLELSFDRGGWRAGTALDALWQDDAGDPDTGVEARLGYAAGDGTLDWGADAYARAGASAAVGARANVEHPLFRASAASDLVEREEGRRTRNSIATASTHIGLDGGGAAVGGADFAESGVIVAVGGEPAGEPFDIVVNGVRATSSEIGRSRFVGLQPFESYAVTLVPRGVLSNGLGDDVHEFTLFPGNVQRIDVTAARQVLMIASLVDEAGAPLGSAVLEIGDNPQVSDVDGIVQAEVEPGATLEVRALDGTRCRVTVPEPGPGEEEVMIPDAPLVCRRSQ